jgi:hypothetical protein
MISTGGSTEAKDGPDAEVPVGEVKVVNNLDWTKDVSLIDFLRTVGKMARVNVMMARDRYILCPIFVVLPLTRSTWSRVRHVGRQRTIRLRSPFPRVSSHEAYCTWTRCHDGPHCHALRI